MVKSKSIRKKIIREISPYLCFLKSMVNTLPTIWKQKQGHENYTVIINGIGQSEHLNRLFQSLINQSLLFTQNIEVICLTSKENESVKKEVLQWIGRYPSNVSVIEVEGNKLAWGRNEALSKVKTSWVTFVESDSFYSTHYFKKIDHFLSKDTGNQIACIQSNSILYDKSKKYFKRFLESNEHLIQGTQSLLMRSDVIANLVLRFGTESSMSDLQFALRYLSGKENLTRIFFSSVVYRSQSHKRSSQIIDPKDYIDLLEEFANDSIIKTLLYGHFAHFLSGFISSSKVNHSFSDETLKRIFSYFEPQLITGSSVHQFSSEEIIGILGRFKEVRPENYQVSIEDYDLVNESVKFSYISYFDEVDSFLINGMDRAPTSIKKSTTYLNEEKFYFKKIVWFKLAPEETLECWIHGQNVAMDLRGTKYSKLLGAYLKNEFEQQKIKAKNSHYKDAWIFLDRLDLADDNAEHLYRYVKDQYPYIKIYFALKKTSKDWARLETEGFHLIDLDSKEAKRAFTDCQKIISSHYHTDLFKKLGSQIPYSKQVVFLQHGITQNDLSNWLNKKKIDLIITSSKKEMESIVGDQSSYRYGTKEVILTGFPRHDRLIRESQKKSADKTILIMPTWRLYLAEKSSCYKNDQYFLNWNLLLNHPGLKKFVDTYQYKILFFPHPNMRHCLTYFNLPHFVEMSHPGYQSIQEFFISSQLLITDYSSVAFEMGVQKKEVIYYQFDEAQFFSGNQIYSKGYFDYREDGFGPVCTRVEEVLDSLTSFVERGGQISDQYLNRISEFFPFLDDKNCERVFLQLQRMDRKGTDQFNLKLALDRANFALSQGEGKLAQRRFQEIVQNYPSEREALAALKLHALKA